MVCTSRPLIGNGIQAGGINGAQMGLGGAR